MARVRIGRRGGRWRGDTRHAQERLGRVGCVDTEAVGFGLPGEKTYWKLRPKSLQSINRTEEQLLLVNEEVKREFEKLKQTL